VVVSIVSQRLDMPAVDGVVVNLFGGGGGGGDSCDGSLGLVNGHPYHRILGCARAVLRTTSRTAHDLSRFLGVDGEDVGVFH